MKLSFHILAFCFFVVGASGQSYISNLNSTGNVPSCVAGGLPEPDPELYYASPTGNIGAAGTQADPFDLRAALDGTETIPLGETLYLLAGVYDDPQPGVTGMNLDRTYHVTQTGITIRPFGLPYSAEVRGGFVFEVGTDNLTIRDILTVNLDPVPGGEPTIDGSPYPGAPGAYVPPEFEDWGASGVGIDGGTGHRVINMVTYGGAAGYGFFQSPGVYFYGNIAYQFGWEAATRVHGHGLYAQNAFTLPGERHVIMHNLFDMSYQTQTNVGNYALHLYKGSGDIQNMTVHQNVFRGSTLIQADTPFEVNDITYTENVAYELNAQTGPGAGGREFTFGGTGLDGSIVLEDNTEVDATRSLVNSGTAPGFASATMSGNRTFKWDATWYRIAQRSTPNGLEEGPFIDVASGGGTDETRVWLNAHDATRAMVTILDFDLSGSVDVDMSSLLGIGDPYEVYHFATINSLLQSGFYGGSITLTPQGVGPGAVDSFIVFRR